MDIAGRRTVNTIPFSPPPSYEMRDVYGPHTIELSNLPLGVTPETLQERFRRFFSKFGHIESCRVCCNKVKRFPCSGSMNPYQVGGKGYITFRSWREGAKGIMEGGWVGGGREVCFIVGVDLT